MPQMMQPAAAHLDTFISARVCASRACRSASSASRARLLRDVLWPLRAL